MKMKAMTAAVSMLALVACSSSPKAEKESAAVVSASAPVNKYCVLMPDHEVDAKNPVTVDYKGQKVGFCCEDCIDGWQQMSDAKKDAMLKKAIAAN